MSLRRVGSSVRKFACTANGGEFSLHLGDPAETAKSRLGRELVIHRCTGYAGFRKSAQIYYRALDKVEDRRMRDLKHGAGI